MVKKGWHRRLSLEDKVKLLKELVNEYLDYQRRHPKASVVHKEASAKYWKMWDAAKPVEDPGTPRADEAVDVIKFAFAT